MNTIACSSCRAQIPSGAKFCPECGAPVGSKAPSVKPAKATGLRDLLIIGGTLVAVGVAYFMIKEQPEPPARPAETPPTRSMGSDPADPHQGMSMAMLDSLPQDLPTLITIGNKFMDEQNFPIAAECYKRALALDSTLPDVRVDYGACLHGMGLPQRALDEFKKALTFKPDHPIAHFNLGIVYREQQMNDSAKVYWTKYLKIDPRGQAADAARQALKEMGG